ncbi:MAG: nitrate- and nitrite sensing domain-containing protein [Oceanicaulis sp.]
MNDDRLPWLGLILLGPIVAMVIVAAQALAAIADSTQRIGSALVAADVAARSALVMDELQSERVNVAAMRLTPALMSHQQYRERTISTDRTIADLLALAETPRQGLSDGTIERITASLEGLGAARQLAQNTDTGLADASAAYTDVLDRFMDALARELPRSFDDERDFATGFVILARLHERIAVETSVGLSSFYTGAVTVESHQTLLEAIAFQDAMIQSFHDLSDPSWSQALDAVLTGIDTGRLAAARTALVEAGYGAPLDTSHRTFWREARLPIYFEIEALRNRYAEDGVSGLIETADARNAEAVRGAGVTFLVLLAVIGATIAGFTRLTAQPRPGPRRNVMDGDAAASPSASSAE